MVLRDIFLILFFLPYYFSLNTYYFFLITS